MSLKDLFLLPNLITLSRLFVSIYLFNQHSFSEFSTFNLVTRLVTILDPVCDRIVFVLLILWLLNIFPLWFFYGILIREVLVMLGSLYVLLNTKTLKVSNFGKFGTVLIFFSICFFVINDVNELVFFQYFGQFSLIFYYFVALEYFYKIFIKNE